ncbi:MAG: hypothetical protein AB7V55_04535 [Oscillospiraceae bacterium]
MIREGIAVLLIGVLLVFAYLRTKHYGYAVAVLPVCFIPVGHLLINLILYMTKGAFFFGIRPAVVIAFTDLLTLAITCVSIVVISRRIESKHNRRLYLAAMLAYSVLLGWAFIFSSVFIILE